MTDIDRRTPNQTNVSQKTNKHATESIIASTEIELYDFSILTLSSTAADIWLAHWIIDQRVPDWAAASHDTSALPLPEPPLLSTWPLYDLDEVQINGDRISLYIQNCNDSLARTHAHTHGARVNSKAFITPLCASWLCNELSDKKNPHADIHPPSDWMSEEIEDLEIVSPRRHWPRNCSPIPLGTRVNYRHVFNCGGQCLQQTCPDMEKTVNELRLRSKGQFVPSQSDPVWLCEPSFPGMTLCAFMWSWVSGYEPHLVLIIFRIPCLHTYIQRNLVIHIPLYTINTL